MKINTSIEKTEERRERLTTENYKEEGCNQGTQETVGIALNLLA